MVLCVVCVVVVVDDIVSSCSECGRVLGMLALTVTDSGNVDVVPATGEEQYWYWWNFIQKSSAR